MMKRSIRLKMHSAIMIDHCRRNDCTYAQTREFVVRETTLRMTEMAKEHNMVEHIKRNYVGKMQSKRCILQRLNNLVKKLER